MTNSAEQRRAHLRLVAARFGVCRACVAKTRAFTWKRLTHKRTGLFTCSQSLKPCLVLANVIGKDGKRTTPGLDLQGLSSTLLVPMSTTVVSRPPRREPQPDSPKRLVEGGEGEAVGKSGPFLSFYSNRLIETDLVLFIFVDMRNQFNSCL